MGKYLSNLTILTQSKRGKIKQQMLTVQFYLGGNVFNLNLFNIHYNNATTNIIKCHIFLFYFLFIIHNFLQEANTDLDTGQILWKDKCEFSETS